DTKVRSEVLKPAQKKVDAINANHKLSKADQDRQSVAIWGEADKKMWDLHLKEQKDDPSNLLQMYNAGVKPGRDQYKQMVLAPLLLLDSANRTIPSPVTRSYA